MYLQKLSVFNYKNIQEANIEFSPRLNCFFGNNGVGKTNFLDAIYYLSFCKSHTNPIDSQNIFHEADYFVLQGNYLIEGKEEEYYCAMKRRQKKIFKFNKKEYERLSDHIGRLPLVIVSPADENLIREGSDERRRFMDIALSQFDHSYMEALMSYNKALYQRNALLKNEQMNREDSLYEMYDAPMSDYARLIYQKRREFIAAFQPVFEHYYHSVSDRSESIGLQYRSHLEQGNLQEQLLRSREKEIVYKIESFRGDKSTSPVCETRVSDKTTGSVCKPKVSDKTIGSACKPKVSDKTTVSACKPSVSDRTIVSNAQISNHLI
jgi:DNA replication and repair protein RecF